MPLADVTAPDKHMGVGVRHCRLAATRRMACRRSLSDYGTCSASVAQCGAYAHVSGEYWLNFR